ncbi:hypothetical protein ACH4D3_16770 [Streptomyces sp. NPDC018026]|uniref:hypothetical protein n=1 Tax=Streptomyces sp. NPDC018026 TaxID=3365031 RepID=UPI0037BA1232
MRRLLWPIAAAALLAAGCSSAPDREAAAEKVPDPRPMGGVLHYTEADAAALHRAEERKVRECMANRGFDYSVVPAGAVERSTAKSPYGLLTPDLAAQDGYGLTVERLKETPADPNARRVSALGEDERLAWEAALKGAADGPREEIEIPDGPTVSVPTDACVTAARQALYGTSWDRNEYTLQALRNTIVQDTLDRAPVKSAERKWAACMRDKGFAYAHREDPLKELRKRLDAAGSDEVVLRATGREELRIAGQDADCQVEAGLAERIAGAQKQVEKALPAARTSVLNDFRAARRAALERAQARGST